MPSMQASVHARQGGIDLLQASGPAGWNRFNRFTPDSAEMSLYVWSNDEC